MTLLLLFQPEPFESLYQSAVAWDQKRHHQEAVILAQISLELLSERVFNRLLDTVQPTDLQAWLRKPLDNNHNIVQEQNRKLYEALSGNLIGQEAFWSGLQEHNTLRNDIIHRGTSITATDSARSLQVVKQAIDYLRLKHIS